MDKLNNINLNILIEFFTFPMNRFLSGVVTGNDESGKLNFLKSLINDAQDEYKSVNNSPLFVIIDNLAQFSNYQQNNNFKNLVLQEIQTHFPPTSANLHFKDCVLKENRPLLIIFNKFDRINPEYKNEISNLIETLFETTENGSSIKISILFLVKGKLNIFEMFDEEAQIKVSSMKLPPYNFDFISS